MTDPDRREAAGNSAPPASSAAAVGERYERLPLLGSLLKFNVKLFANGVLDLALVPASLVAVGLGLAMGGNDPRRYFRELMLFGRRTEHWINLFGSHADGSRHDSPHGGIDAVLGGYEQEVAQAFERRGWSSRAERALRHVAIGSTTSGAPAASPAPAGSTQAPRTDTPPSTQ